MPESPKRTALYRLRDANGRLLYVGISRNPRIRWHQHSTSKPWWHLVARRDIEWHPDRPTADAAETAAIEAEAPLYNIDKVPNARAGQGSYDDTADRKRAKRLLRRDAKRQYFHVGRTVHVTVLAERYEVSARTLWSEITRSNARCFARSHMRITVLHQPKF